MLKSLSTKSWTASDIIHVVTGLGLLLSPWYLGYSGERYATWNAWIVGTVATIVAISALVAFNEYEEWLNLVLGLWAIVAPWALGFAATAAAMAHVIAGLVIAVLVAGRVWFIHNRPVFTS